MLLLSVTVLFAQNHRINPGQIQHKKVTIPLHLPNAQTLTQLSGTKTVINEFPYYEGFEYKNFSGKIKFMYYSFNSETLFKSDELLSNNASNYIITETNKSLPLLTKVNSVGRKNYRYKSKNGLSAGGIVAIVIASVVTVAAVIGITIILRKPTTITSSDTATSSISILK